MTQPAVAEIDFGLRDYQQRAIDMVRREMARGRRRVVLVLPTGAGKTRVGSCVVHQAVAKSNPVVWLAHRNELVEQAARTLEGFGLHVGCLAASSRRAPDPTAPIQVASIQTLVARPDVRPPCRMLVWDEAHHASDAAECWSGLLDAYPDVPMLGLTATPERGDGAGLAPLFNGIVVGASVRELTALWHTDPTQGLVPCEIIRPGRQLEPGQIAQSPVDAYRDHGGGRQAILFARSVEEAVRYAAELNARGVRSECITATTPQVDRDAVLDLYRRGQIRVLTNVYVLTEGTDLPMAEVCILARGAQGAGMLLQMVGRVLRPSRGKTSALLIDLRGVTWTHGSPEDERVYSLEGRGMSLAAVRHCQVCGAIVEGYPCECGYCPASSGDGVQTEITGEPLVKFARMRALDEQARSVRLVAWVREVLAKGHKPTSVRYKWRAVFGEELPTSRLMWAISEAQRGS